MAENDLTGGNGHVQESNGLGNLADELAEAWDDEGGEDEYEDEINLNFASAPQTNDFGSPVSPQSDKRQSIDLVESMHDMGIGGTGYNTSRALQHAVSGEYDDRSLSPTANRALRPSDKRVMQHRRHESTYDGSDYGNDSDLEDTGGFTPGLEARMSGIESLARRGTEANGSSSDLVVERTVEQLKDLGGQSGIENGATR